MNRHRSGPEDADAAAADLVTVAIGTCRDGLAPPLREPGNVGQEIDDSHSEQQTLADDALAVARRHHKCAVVHAGGKRLARDQRRGWIRGDLLTSDGEDLASGPAVQREDPVRMIGEAISGPPRIDDRDAPARPDQRQRGRKSGEAAADDNDVKRHGSLLVRARLATHAAIEGPRPDRRTLPFRLCVRIFAAARVPLAAVVCQRRRTTPVLHAKYLRQSRQDRATLPTPSRRHSRSDGNTIPKRRSKWILLRDFNWLWAGQTLSLFGSTVSRLAIPTTAIFALHASAFQVGALGAAGFVAFPVLGVFAGVWVDRWPRRRVLMVCDIVRTLALATIPLAAALHALTLSHLFVVALVSSVASVFFDVAYQAYLPELVPVDGLHDANARLEFSNSAAQIAGNAAAGGLIAALGAALAVAADAASFGLSVITLAFIRRRPPVVKRVEAGKTNFGRQLRDGIDCVFSNVALLRIVACTATSNLGGSMLAAVYLVFAYRTLHLTPSVVGVILAVGNAGFIGALFAPRIVRRFGLPSTLIWSMLVAAAVQGLVPLAARGFTIPLLIAEQFVASAATPIYNIAQVSWRQSTVPPDLQGRMNATVRTIAWGTLPVGAFIGATLSASAGIVPTLVIAAIVQMSAVVWLLNGHVRAIRA